MGDFGIAGLWVLLALSLVAAVAVAAASIWLANRTLPKTVSRRAQRGTVAVHDLCRPRVRRPARIRHRGRVGAVLVGGDQRLQRGVDPDHDVPADRRHAGPGADPDAGAAAQVHVRGRRAPNGRTRYATAVEPKARETRSTRCTGCSAVSSPVSRRARSVRSSLTSWARWRRSGISESWTPNRGYPGLLWTGLLFGGVVLLGLAVSCGWAARGAFRPAECGRRTTRPAAVRRVLARPSVRQPVRCDVRTVRAVAERFRLDRPGDMTRTRSRTIDRRSEDR